MTRVRLSVLLALGFVLFSAILVVFWLSYRNYFVLYTDDTRIESRLVDISSRLSERVMSVLVNEGDTVRKGQILAYLDKRSIVARKRQAEARLALARAGLDEARAGARPQEILRAKALLDHARALEEKALADHRRLEKLAGQDGGVTQADRDAAKSAYLSAKATSQARLDELDLLKAGTRIESIQSAEARVEQVLAELEEIAVLDEETVVRSPVNGVVAQKLVDEGEFTTPGQRLFSLTNADDTWLSARIEETRIGNLHLGQKVKFSIDAYPGLEFEGAIYEISPATSATFSLISTENVAGYFTKIMQRIPVKISLPTDVPPHVVFRVGMQGHLEIHL